MKPEIVKVWLCGDTDGYSHYFRTGRAVLTKAEAEEYERPSGYCVTQERWAAKIGNKYYLLDGNTDNPEGIPKPLTMGLKTESEEDRKKKAALAKLTHAERKLLGLESYDL